MALPGSPITVRTSSKSTFTWPGTLMISAMPPTAFFSTSLAWAKASSCVTSSPSTSSSFSLSTTISESTLASSSARPLSALVMRRPPSNSNGLVTTPTVRMPISRATRAITGAAPVPVPPPMPAVMNSMCAPSMAARMSSTASSAASRPLSGLLPAPRPLVPSWMVLWASLRLSACASVLAQMNSTPCTRAVDHVVDRVAAAAADADHLDLGALVKRFFFNHFDRHFFLLKFQIVDSCQKSCRSFLHEYREGGSTPSPSPMRACAGEPEFGLHD